MYWMATPYFYYYISMAHKIIVYEFEFERRLWVKEVIETIKVEVICYFELLANFTSYIFLPTECILLNVLQFEFNNQEYRYYTRIYNARKKNFVLKQQTLK